MKLPSVTGTAGTRKKPDHDHAVHGEQPVVGFRRAEKPLRNDEIEAHERRGDAPNEEKERDGREVQDRDALVIGGEGAKLRKVWPSSRYEPWMSSRSTRDGVDRGGGAHGFAPGARDLMYATSFTMSSSLI